MSKTVRKKRKEQGLKKSNSSTNPDRGKGAGGSNMRDRSTIKRLEMYRKGKPKRNRKGKIVQAAPFQSQLKSGTVARVEPNRKWFGNTRVVSQNALQTFQEELGKVIKDPYQVVMKQTKLPITLLQEKAKYNRVHLLDTESFGSTFGPKKQRKRVNMKVADVESLLKSAEESSEKYDVEKDKDLVFDDQGVRDEVKDWIFSAGQSKRIWNELYKVVDSSDVLVQVLDARDPMGTRSKYIENYLKKEKPHKHLIFVLNKVDLVPTWATKRWVAILSHDYPTLAFHASMRNPFGKGALIQLLRQFGKLHIDKKQISIGFIGYPNVGKSSIINTLRNKKVCNVAPIAGETKVWQYITLMRRIFLIDCPGVVYPSGETETEIVLKGVVRVENVKCPEDYIAEVLRRVKPDYVQKTYRITEWVDYIDFLEKLAQRTGKLNKGGEPDVSTVAKMVLNDWLRGKIPFFVKPPNCEQDPKDDTNKTNQAKKNKETVAKETVAKEDASSKKKKGAEIRGVKQDLSKLNIGPNFAGDDLKPEDIDEEENEVTEGQEPVEEDEMENDDEDMERDDDEELEESVIEDGQKEGKKETSNEAASSSSPVKQSSKRTRKEDAKTGISFGANVFLNSKNKKLLAKAKIEKKREAMLKKRSEMEQIEDQNKPKKAKKPQPIGSYCPLGSSDEDDVGDMRRKKKRYFEEEKTGKKKLTSKQKRSIERAQKSKKVGHHYYAEKNVKNRNRSKRDK
ncbi:nucleolar GTP-binding protein 2-like [Lytechinus pictus]|uniref:nucleolar GTP-binding protein 2-like n=1 Tax=Lytechinus pictus TaxID=7653 RepID=UPI0030B9C730